MLGEIIPANSGEWIDELRERLYAHFLRVSEYLDREGAEWEAWTLEELRRSAPDWCAQGFHDMGWPTGLPIGEGADGRYFEPHESGPDIETPVAVVPPERLHSGGSELPAPPLRPPVSPPSSREAPGPTSPAPTVTLYHGTGMPYEGPPLRGGKYVLGTPYLSMSGNKDMAELFAGGSFDARVFSTAIPNAAIYDMQKESEELGLEGRWDELRQRIMAVAATGQYQAIAISDITMGTHEPEYRLVQHIPPEKWDVYQSADGPLYIEPVSAKETAEYDMVEDWEQSARRRLIGNYGFWMLAAGFVVGLLIFFNQLDVQEKEPEPVDRTPATAAAEVR